MRSIPRVLLATGLVAVVAGAAIYGCSKSKGSSPTAPGSATVLSLPLPANGGEAEYTFTEEGTFPYRCGIHPIMSGDAVIVDSSSVTTTIDVNVTGIEAPGFSPSTVTIRPGGTVHWINNTGTDHLVVND